MPNCPDDTELAGFLNDALGDARGAHVSGHVDGCPLCQARLDRLTEQTNGAVARYKELPSVDLPDARSGGSPQPEAATQILGAKPAFPAFAGLPRVPGFEVLTEIGRGGMGVVYKARHRRLNRLVALKMILAGAADPANVQRFLFEGEVLARVQHPQVVTVFEVGTYEGPTRAQIPYLAMELLEGGSLSRRLREGAPPEPRAAAELLEGLARAVHAAHLQGVVHRDLKPGNILFEKDEGGRMKDEGEPEESAPVVSSFILPPSSLRPKVTDFGLAKFTEGASDLTRTGQIVGTPQYMAPEQAQGERRIGPAVDVYALGAILFECLAGRAPFTGPEPMSVMLKVINDHPSDVRALNPAVPRDLAAVTMKCLAKEPGRRYASAEALADDLRRFLDGRPTKARPVTNAERVWRTARRNPAVSALLAALAVSLTAVFVAVAVLWTRAEDRARTEAELRRAAQDASARAADEVQARRRNEARLEFARAVEWCEDGRAEPGLARFVRALELAEVIADEPLARAARINLAAWAQELPKPPHRFAHKEQPRAVAFHPDGRHMVSAGRDRELYLWDITTGARVRTYKPVRDLFDPLSVISSTYWSVALSPDGRHIAAGGTDGAVTLWETDPGGPPQAEPLAQFKLPAATVFGLAARGRNIWVLAFTADRVLWTNDGADGLIRWNLADPKKPRSERFGPPASVPAAALQALCVSPDRRTVYTGDRAGRVRAWDAGTGVLQRNWRVSGWVADVAVSPDGTRLAATGPYGFVSVFDLTAGPRSGDPVLELDLAGAYGNGVAFAPKRPYLAASDGDGNVRFWHRDTGQVIGLKRRFHGEVLRARFRPDSDQFAVPAGDSVSLCTAPDPPGDLLWRGNGSRVRGLDFAPGGEQLAVADETTCGLLNLRGGAWRPLPAEEPALTLRFDPNPARAQLFRGTREGFERLALPGGAPTAGDPFNRARVSCLGFPRDGSSVYAMSTSAVARYDPDTRKRFAIERPASRIPVGVDLSALAVRPDGGEVFVSFSDRAAVLKGDTLERLRAWSLGDEVLDARYTPDGTKILLGCRSGTAELRDAQTGARVGPAMPHRGAVAGVAVAPGGAVLATASRDGSARFWDAATGLPLGPPLIHAGPVTHVTFAPNGEHVVTGTGTGHVMLWDVPPPQFAGALTELRTKFPPRD